MTVAADIRAILKKGEWVSVQDTIDSLGASPSHLGQVVKRLEKDGHKFERERRGRYLYFRQKNSEAVSEVVPDEVKSTPEPEELPLPALLETLTVSALAVDRRGKVGMTLRNGKFSWRVIIEGGAPK